MDPKSRWRAPGLDLLPGGWRSLAVLGGLLALAIGLQLAWAVMQARDTRLASPVAVQASPGDISLGRPEAPVTIVALLSLTCEHCRHWADNNLMPLLAGPVAAGQARLVLRPYPLDAPALDGAAMLACLPPGQGIAGLRKLFADPATLAAHGAAEMAALAGVAAADIPAVAHCAEQQKQAILQGVASARRDWGVSVTPTFLVGQHLHAGALPASELQRLVAEEAATKPHG